ncbi:hypothetical protein M0804_015445, partial [Polistes exclamans]
TLNESDRRTTCYVTKKVHGIPFRDFGREKYEQHQVHEELFKLRQAHGSELLIAYKGGHIEKDLLNDAYIDCVNLEIFDCPKFNELIKIYEDSNLQNCYLHTSAKTKTTIHCPVVETLVYRKCEGKHFSKPSACVRLPAFCYLILSLVCISNLLSSKLFCSPYENTEFNETLKLHKDSNQKHCKTFAIPPAT